MAFLTHVLSDGPGQVSWSVSYRSPSGDDAPYGASITHEIPEPALILELLGWQDKAEFAAPDLSDLGADFVLDSLRPVYLKHDKKWTEGYGERSLLVYSVSPNAPETDFVPAAQRLAGCNYRITYVKKGV